MQKISGPGATPAQEFTEGSPATGTPATVVTAAFMNAVQRELVGVVAAAGIALNPNDDAQLLAAIRFLATAGGAASRNLLLNGGFDLQQRVLNVGNFAVTNAPKYTLDRWRCHADLEGSGSGAATISRQAFGTGQVDVPGNPRFYMRWVQTTASSAGAPGLEQRVEDVTRFGDGPICFNAYLKGSAALAGTLRITQVFGTGGSPSASVVVASQAVSISTSWQRFFVAVNLTDAAFTMAGKTIGSNDDSYLKCELVLPNGTSSWTIEIANAQLEHNSVPSTFVAREPGQELIACQRYYERTGKLSQGLDSSTAFDGSIHLVEAPIVGNDKLFGVARPFMVPKRKIPTVRWWHPGASTPDTINWGGIRVVTSTPQTSELGLGYVVLTTIPGSIAHADAHYEADAEL